MLVQFQNICLALGNLLLNFNNRVSVHFSWVVAKVLNLEIAALIHKGCTYYNFGPIPKSVPTVDMIWLRALPRQLPHCIPHQYRLTNLSTYLEKSLNTSWQICESAVRLILSDYLVYNPPHCITIHCTRLLQSLHSHCIPRHGDTMVGYFRVCQIEPFFCQNPNSTTTQLKLL